MVYVYICFHWYRTPTARAVAEWSIADWKATKEYLNHKGTKIRAFRECFKAHFLPPLSPHFSPLFPLQPLFSCESWLAFLIFEPGNPPAISCGFLPCAPRSRIFFFAGKCIFLQECAFFCRKVHFSVGNAFFCRKVHFSVGNFIFAALCSGGSRIMNGSLFLDDVHPPTNSVLFTSPFIHRFCDSRKL